jgi:malate dehydrogenase (oxaloacetate-decarboxylating)(NADP+)
MSAMMCRRWLSTAVQLQRTILPPLVLPRLEAELDRRIRSTESRMLPPTTFGAEIIYDPIYNKGTGFSQREQDRLGLRGLVTPGGFTLEQQAERAYYNFHRSGGTIPNGIPDTSQKSLVAKHLFMVSLQDRNETLFYRLVKDHIAEMAPIIYTPTVGFACVNANMLFRRPRGMYFTARDLGDMDALVRNWPRSEVDVVVITDGSRILGLGDLGVQGMAIPIGKISLYVAAGGLDPSRCMPVVIDVGTDNTELLENKHYMGLRHPRITGKDYVKVLDEVVISIARRFPKAIIQFEDFKTPNAEMLLKRYQNVFRCFNDDIQGIGAMTLAGLLAALRRTDRLLFKCRVVCVGAGSAGLGVCNVLLDAMERQGLTREEALRRFYLIDKDGLITAKRSELQQGQDHFARADCTEDEGAPLLETIKRAKPHILLGVSGVGGAFSEDCLRQMASTCDMPIIFAMSNPTHLSECTAEQAYTWTDGRTIFASGSPFDPVTVDNVTHIPSQSNNMYIFPGVGFGALASGARIIPQHMFYRAAVALSETVTEDMLSRGEVFPGISDIRNTSHRIAVAVAKTAVEDGVATIVPDDHDWERHVLDRMWEPTYRSLVHPLTTLAQ